MHMNDYNNIENIEYYIESGVGKTRKDAIENAFLNFRKSLKNAHENDYIVYCQSTSVDFIEEKIHTEVERFLFLFLPREKNEYEVKIKIKIKINYVEIQ